MRIVLAMLLAWPAASYAQTAAGPRFELDAGGGVLGGAGLGAADANLRANAQARESFRLFTADSRFGRAGSLHVRAGLALGGRFGLEGGMTRSRPEMRTSITADAESAASLTSVERVDQYVFDASFVMKLGGLRGGALVPFVAGGGGYLRQLHEGRTLIEHGQAYHAGGGIKYALLRRPDGFLRSVGVRADVRVQVLRGGISLKDRPRSHPAISGSVFVGF